MSKRAIEFVKRRYFALGMALGVFTASTLMLWLGSDLFAEKEYQQDLDSHLGLNADEIPVVALVPLPISKVARSLNISDPQEAMALAKVMSNRVSSGFLPDGWAEDCREKYHPTLCHELDAYFKWTEVRNKSTMQISRRHKIEFKTSNILSLQKSDLGLLLSRAGNEAKKTLIGWSKLAVKTEDCPRNASIALARMWEFHLQSSEALEWMNRLDDHGTECMNVDSGDYEYINMRIGLWAVAASNWERALKYLGQAARATNQRENYRVQFWLARAFGEIGDVESAAKARLKVRKEYPLSWYAIEVSLEENLDPLKMAESVEPYRDEYFSDDRSFNRSLSWFYLISRMDEDGSLDKFSAYIYDKLGPDSSPGLYQHVARVLEGNRRHRMQIMILRKLFVMNSKFLNVESLRLYFPRPFFDKIDELTPTLDSALLLGLMRQESGFDPLARSSANAYGLLQILPRTAKDIRRRVPAEKLYDSATNIEIGSVYFQRLVSFFDGSMERALAGYNAGMGRVRGWSRSYEVSDEQLFMDLIPYRETREYVPSILRNAYWYHRLFPEMSKDIGNGVLTSRLLNENLAKSLVFLERDRKRKLDLLEEMAQKKALSLETIVDEEPSQDLQN